MISRTYSKKIGTIETYVQHAYQQGLSKEEIGQELLNAGWDDKVVDALLTEVKENTTKTALESFVESSKNKGITPEMIAEQLKEQGWKEDTINRALEQKKETGYAEKSEKSEEIGGKNNENTNRPV